MMVCNLWMLKAPNGMFWYCIDYIRRVNLPCTVLVRKQLFEITTSALSGMPTTVVPLGRLGFLKRVAGAMYRRSFVYCPTPHPIPFLARQTIVFHDHYPFEGKAGWAKRKLLAFGLKTSGCDVAHINRTIAVEYLKGLGLQQARIFFAPNIPPRAETTARSPSRHERFDGRAVVVGAFGSDSTKKNYEALLDAIGQAIDPCLLRIYGQENAYTQHLRRRFGERAFYLVDSSTTSLSDFLATVDAVISAAEGEGFGRPIATAILAKIPCFLLDTPSFREFFNHMATFLPTVEQLVESASIVGSNDGTDLSPTGFLAPDYAAAIDLAVRRIRRQAMQ